MRLHTNQWPYKKRNLNGESAEGLLAFFSVSIRFWGFVIAARGSDEG